jgi:hypothetical protein
MRLRKRRVRLHFKDRSPSLDGILTGTVDGHFIIRAAVLINGSEDVVTLDGDVEVPRRNVLFLQRLGDQ